MSTKEQTDIVFVEEGSDLPPDENHPFPVPQLTELCEGPHGESRIDLANRIIAIGNILHTFMAPTGEEDTDSDPRVTKEIGIFGQGTVYKIDGTVPGLGGKANRRIFVESTYDSFTLRGFGQNSQTGEKTQANSFDLTYGYIAKDPSYIRVIVNGMIPTRDVFSHKVYPEVKTHDGNGDEEYKADLAVVTSYLTRGLKDFVEFLKMSPTKEASGASSSPARQ